MVVCYVRYKNLNSLFRWKIFKELVVLFVLSILECFRVHLYAFVFVINILKYYSYHNLNIGISPSYTKYRSITIYFLCKWHDSSGFRCKMKGGFYIGKASLLMFMLTNCLLHSFPLTEARDLEDELINNRGKGLTTLSLKTRPS